MVLRPNISKLNLISHITFSIGWIGAVTVFLVLAITGLINQDIVVSRAAYIAIELSAVYVIVPFCLASFFTGVVQAVGTKWGLLKHYWIAVKLFLTLGVTVFLLLHLKPIKYLAGIASGTPLAYTQEYSLRVQAIAQAGAAILLLLAITTISIYKPWGRIRFGIHNDSKSNSMQYKISTVQRSKGFYILIGFAVVVITLIIIHLFGGGIGIH